LQAYVDANELRPVSVPTDSFFGQRRCMMMFLLLMILLTYIALMSSPSLVWIVGNISERSATANHRYAVGAAFFGVLSVR
jgi:phosphotransferase system  glucose/maltose/N-acetylglucosamine-specific IIC component